MSTLQSVEEIAHKIHDTFASAYALDEKVDPEWLKNVTKQALNQTAEKARVEERERVDKEVLTPLYDEIQSWYVEKGDIVGQGALIPVFDEAIKNLSTQRRR